MVDMPEWAELQSQLGRALLEGVASYDWVTAQLRFRSVASVGEGEVILELPSGDRLQIAPPSGTLSTFNKLRRRMASPEHGTWMSATVMLTRDANGDVDVDCTFDYDNRPDWNIEPDRQTYLDDLRTFPRPAAEIPDWHPANATGQIGG